MTIGIADGFGKWIEQWLATLRVACNDDAKARHKPSLRDANEASNEAI